MDLPGYAKRAVVAGCSPALALPLAVPHRVVSRVVAERIVGAYLPNPSLRWEAQVEGKAGVTVLAPFVAELDLGRKLLGAAHSDRIVGSMTETFGASLQALLLCGAHCTAPSVVQALQRCPQLQKLSLRNMGCVTEELLTAVRDEGCAGGVTELLLAAPAGLKNDRFRLLPAAFPALAHLTLTYLRCGDEELSAALPHTLLSLRMSCVSVGPHTVAAIGRCASLRLLDLRNAPHSGGAMPYTVLAGTPAAASLEELWIGELPAPEEADLAAFPLYTALRRLGILGFSGFTRWRELGLQLPPRLASLVVPSADNAAAIRRACEGSMTVSVEALD